MSEDDELAGEHVDLRSLTPGVVVRRRALHEQFGGQQQGGISTPSRFPVVILFTGASGSQHGYDDGWSDGVFCYFGEGQIGDMPWVRGNAAIRDHASSGRDLFLFEILEEPQSHVRFVGTFVAASWEYRTAPDRQAKPRRAIVFHLIPTSRGIEDIEVGRAISVAAGTASLRSAAYAAGVQAPTQTVREAKASYVERSAVVRAYALHRAAGSCEACSARAPFETSAGVPYLEVHHIHWLADGGPDRPNAVAAICPNCHRAAHFSRSAQQMNAALASTIRAKEQAAEEVLA